MGLDLSVGLLADLRENDDENSVRNLTGRFAEINKLLSAHGLPAHSEPLDVEPWGAEMYGYSGLHYLRRLAAYVDSGPQLPGPGDDSSANDARLKAYYENVFEGRSASWLQRLSGKPRFRREFDHLIVHSDAEGFYLPQDFAQVLITPDDTNIPGGMVGSTQRLLTECDRLARVLAIPSEITKDSKELWEAAASQAQGDTLWQRYGIESFTCVALREACRRSLETGAALAFV